MVIGGNIVSKSGKDKVINLFSNHNSNCVAPEAPAKVKFFAGFNYVKLEKDSNGNKFNTPRFTDSNAISDNRLKKPAAIAIPEYWAMVINDPSCFEERSPVIICFNTTSSVLDS